MNILTKSLRNCISYRIRSPLDINLFKNQQNLSKVKQSLKARFRNQNIADDISKNLESYRVELHNLELLNKKSNSIKNQLKNLMKNSKKQGDINLNQQLQTMKTQANLIKQDQKNKQNNIKQLINEIQISLLKVGNLVHQQVPVSKNEDDNKCIRKYHPLGKTIDSKDLKYNIFNKNQSKYQDLNQKFQISDLKRGQKVSGHRGYFLKTNGLKLAFALTQYALEFLQNQGYSLYQAPAIIVGDVLRQNCQLQTVQNDMYKLQGQNSFLIATSQQALAGYYKGEVIQLRTLPIRMGGYSTCFRKQAGAHGKDIHGLFRVHQFEKVQQFLICQPQKSNEQMKNMLNVSEKFYQSLKIPYQIVDIVSGQLNDAAIRKFDLQAWYPSQQKYRQLVSISNCTDYQSRLTDVSYRKGNSTEYVHMLNGTLTAVERTVTCILENYYDSQKNVLKIPERLQKYFGKELIKPSN